MPRAEIVIDGNRFTDYSGFVAEFNRAYLAAFDGPPWNGQDYEDFDEMLEFPSERYATRWLQSE